MANPAAEAATPADICPQKGAASQGGRTLPSGLLQPPGKSSSIVINVPPRGQPTKNSRNAKPSGKSNAKRATSAPVSATVKRMNEVFILGSGSRYSLFRSFDFQIPVRPTNSRPTSISRSALRRSHAASSRSGLESSPAGYRSGPQASNSVQTESALPYPRARVSRSSRGSRSPKYRSASYTLCARHLSATFSTTAAPPIA